MIQFPMSHFTLVKKEDGGFILVAEASETLRPGAGEEVSDISSARGRTGFAIESNKTGTVRFFQRAGTIAIGDEISAWRYVDVVDSRNEVHLFNT